MNITKFNLKTSFLLSCFYILIHAGAIIILFWLTIPLWLKIFLFIACVASFIYIITLQAWRINPKAIICCWPENNKNWLLQDRRGNVFAMQLLGSSICTVHFVLLNFKSVANKWLWRSVVILPDAMDKDDFRKLRVLLRFGN